MPLVQDLFLYQKHLLVTGLLLFTFSAKPTTLVNWLWNLHVDAVTFLLVFNLSFACWQTSKIHEMIKIVQFSFILNKY